MTAEGGRMAVVLTQHSYGKSRVRLTKVQRHADRHELAEWSLDVRLDGDFAAAYTAGDNRTVVATDTMKNVVYALARDHALAAPEDFALALARHFLDSYPQVASASIHISVEPWQRVEVCGRPHPHAFAGGAPGRRTCSVTLTRDGQQVGAGIDGLPLLKTTDSAFRGFHRDAYTTLPDADDRIMATDLTADWLYAGAAADWDACYDQVRRALVETFAGHRSLGVQQTLHAMGTAALAACPAVGQITLTMPNRHRLLVNLAPLGRDNPNAVFVTTDEPFGVITGTLRRE
jgi:urate oxidase